MQILTLGSKRYESVLVVDPQHDDKTVVCVDAEAQQDETVVIRVSVKGDMLRKPVRIINEDDEVIAVWEPY